MPEDQFLKKLLDGVNAWITSPHTDARSSRKRLESTLKATTSKWEVVKEAGISYFTGHQLAAVESLIEDLAKIGVFVVPCGELEQWIDTGVSKGREWNRKALEKLQTIGCPAELEAFVQRGSSTFCRPPPLQRPARLDTLFRISRLRWNWRTVRFQPPSPTEAMPANGDFSRLQACS